MRDKFLKGVLLMKDEILNVAITREGAILVGVIALIGLTAMGMAIGLGSCKLQEALTKVAHKRKN